MKKKLFIVAAWLLVWQAAALLIDNEILMVGPVECVQALVRLASTGSFWLSILQSFGHIGLGICLGAVIGTALAALAYARPGFSSFFSPFVQVVKAIPVASFVILVLIWAGNTRVSTMIVTLVVFPIFYLNVLSGLKGMDQKMKDMMAVLRVPRKNRIRYVYMPYLKSILFAAFSLGIGMGFKSGVAAEVIGQPLGTIGNGLYRAKIFLDTADLFAWTFTVIILSWACERLVQALMKRAGMEAPQ